MQVTACAHAALISWLTPPRCLPVLIGRGLWALNDVRIWAFALGIVYLQHVTYLKGPTED